MPYLRERESLQPKEKAGASIAESVAAADTATRYGFAMIILHFHLQPQFKNELFHILHIMAAIVTSKQEQLSTTNNVTFFTCKNFSENSYPSSKTTVEN